MKKESGFTTINNLTPTGDYKQGKDLHVDRVVNYKGLTRFYIGNGKYITSNKKFVKFI
ncbi:DUF5776 domain-containing protein [Lactobacillaceae bacterium Melli_B3]